jgi:hypothetical protein
MIIVVRSAAAKRMSGVNCFSCAGVTSLRAWSGEAPVLAVADAALGLGDEHTGNLYLLVS